MMIPHAVRQRGAYGNRVPGLIDPKALSAFTPLSVSGLSLWHDFSDENTLFTDAGSTPVSSDGDSIYQVNDKSGNSVNAIQATSGYRPLYKTGVQNSLSAGRFDGSDDFLAFTLSAAITRYTIFAVVKALVTPSNDTFFAVGTNYTNNQAMLTRMDSATSLTLGEYYNDLTATVSNMTTLSLFTFVHDSDDDLFIYQNGTLKNSAAKSALFAGNTSGYVGKWGHPSQPGQINADVYEILLYNNGLATADRQALESLLNNKWDVY